MNFENIVHKEVFENVHSWLKNTSFDFTVNVDATVFTVQFGTTGIFISIHSVREEEAYIHFYALVTKESRVDADLMEYLIRANNNFFCGAFSLDKENSIWLQYSVLGSSCNRDEFANAISAVSVIADEYDVEIIKRWGGTTGKAVLNQSI